MTCQHLAFAKLFPVLRHLRTARPLSNAARARASYSRFQAASQRRHAQVRRGPRNRLLFFLARQGTTGAPGTARHVVALREPRDARSHPCSRCMKCRAPCVVAPMPPQHTAGVRAPDKSTSIRTRPKARGHAPPQLTKTSKPSDKLKAQQHRNTHPPAAAQALLHDCFRHALAHRAARPGCGERAEIAVCCNRRAAPDNAQQHQNTPPPAAAQPQAAQRLFSGCLTVV